MEGLSMWERTSGFNSPGEYHSFTKYIEEQITAGLVEEIDPDPNYGKGEIYGGRWFKNLETSETWRLIPPDIPFKGLWELVEGEY